MHRTRFVDCRCALPRHLHRPDAEVRIHVIILMWWFFIIYMFVRINRQNEAPVFRDELSDCNEV